MEKNILQAKKRKITGKKVKQLRSQGLLPANIFGKGLTSQSIELPEKDFFKLFNKVGETSVVYIKLDGTEELPTLITNLQFDPITRSLLHVDFHKISLTEKVTARVPVVPTGDSKAISDKIGSLLTLLSEVEVEALPSNLPEKIEVDISSLKNIEESLKIKDIKVDSTKVTILSDPEQELFRIEPLVSKEAEELAKEEKEKAAAAVPAPEETQNAAPADASKAEETQKE